LPASRFTISASVSRWETVLAHIVARIRRVVDALVRERDPPAAVRLARGGARRQLERVDADLLVPARGAVPEAEQLEVAADLVAHVGHHGGALALAGLGHVALRRVHLPLVVAGLLEAQRHARRHGGRHCHTFIAAVSSSSPRSP
jgi:hypothetical protein